MPEHTEIDVNAHPAEATPESGKRFRRSFMGGYKRNLVDDTVARLELRVADLEEQSVQLREELLESQHVAGEARHDLTRARAELRYWNDRASYVDSEVARARQRAQDLEQTARTRAEAIESDAQERSLQLIDRVCSEANQIMQAAREEAREMFLRFETDVDMSQQKLDKLEQVRRDVAQTMQGALNQFEAAVHELDKVAPAKRIVTQLETPTRRSAPTFGRKKAQDAARKFDQGVEHVASAAMSTPVETPTLLAAEVTDAVVEQPVVAVQDSSPKVAPVLTQPRRDFDADEDFAALLMQP